MKYTMEYTWKCKLEKKSNTTMEQTEISKKREETMNRHHTTGNRYRIHKRKEIEYAKEYT